MILNGGNITDCQSKYNGGGVFVSIGRFTLSGGCIADCSAGCGGGVYVESNAAFTMNSGNISECSAECNGGGVCVEEDSAFTITGGGITDYRAENGGHYTGAELIFSDGGDLTGEEDEAGALVWSAQCLAASESAEHELVFAYTANPDVERSFIAAAYDASGCLKEIGIIAASEITDPDRIRTGITVQNGFTYRVFALDASFSAPCSKAALFSPSLPR